MTIPTVFINDRTQLVRLPAEARLPDGVGKVQVGHAGAVGSGSPVMLRDLLDDIA